MEVQVSKKWSIKSRWWLTGNWIKMISGNWSARQAQTGKWP